MKVLVSLLSAEDSFYHKILQNFATGIKAHGDQVLFDETKDKCDVAVMFGTIKMNRGRSTIFNVNNTNDSTATAH